MKISQLLSLPFSFSLIASSAAAFENNPFIAEYNTLIAEYTQKRKQSQACFPLFAEFRQEKDYAPEKNTGKYGLRQVR